VCTAKGVPVSVAPGQHEAKEGSFNIILWADHRASEEGKTINATDSMVLKYVGGIVSHVHGLVLSFDALEQMSIEMEMPKVGSW
jgi:ribulose kinase